MSKFMASTIILGFYSRVENIHISLKLVAGVQLIYFAHFGSGYSHIHILEKLY